LQSSDPFLPVGGLHLWRIDCHASGDRLRDLWPLLSDRERARAEGLRFEHHRTRYLRAHAGLRRILARYLRIPARSLDFQYGSAGKPYLSPSLSGSLEFNMTTSADLALVAVSADSAVGIDCERVRPRRDLIGLTKRMFGTEEASALAAAPESERMNRFYRDWTDLEARVKADGRGLFRRRDVPPMPALTSGHVIPANGFIAAVARETLPPVNEWQTLVLPDADG
jgi:4'-phosphopantetheinyl transferase